MKPNRLVIETLIVALLLVLTLLGSLDASSQAPPVNASVSIVDTVTIAQLSRGPSIVQPQGLQATATITDAAWLAAGVLLAPIYYNVELPLVTR